MKKIVISAYILLCFSFSVFSYLFIDPNFIFLKKIFTGFAFSNRIEVSAMYVFFILIFFFLYVYVLRNFSNNKNKKLILSLTGISILLIFSYPTLLSYDIFNYVATSKVAFLFKENPYLVKPNEFIGDTTFIFTRATNKLALYGFVWILLTYIPHVLAFGNYLFGIFLFKILVLFFYISLCFLIHKLSNNDIAKTSFFALNPLVLIETLVSGHNDVVMMSFTFLSLYLFKKKKLSFGLIMFFLAFFIKYAVIALAPVIIYVLVKNKRNEHINWEKIWIYSGFLMAVIFLLSPIREELYPWYTLWILPFISLSNVKHLKRIAVVLTLGLMLSYVPYMVVGEYSKIVIMLKYIIPALCLFSILVYEFIKKYI